MRKRRLGYTFNGYRKRRTAAYYKFKLISIRTK